MRSRVSKTRVYFPPIEVTGKVTLNFCTMGINGFVASKSDELTSRLVVCSMHSRFMVSWNARKILSKILQPFSYLFLDERTSKIYKMKKLQSQNGRINGFRFLLVAQGAIVKFQFLSSFVKCWKYFFWYSMTP
jgi:hypothetical protein